MWTDPVAVSVAVNELRKREGRIARWLYGLLTGGAPPGTRTPNPRIKSAKQAISDDVATGRLMTGSADPSGFW